MKLTIFSFITIVVVVFTGCSKMQIEDFTNNKSPEFIPQEYFNGSL